MVTTYIVIQHSDCHIIFISTYKGSDNFSQILPGFSWLMLVNQKSAQEVGAVGLLTRFFCFVCRCLTEHPLTLPLDTETHLTNLGLQGYIHVTYIKSSFVANCCYGKSQHCM